jgi:hypothetical protein
MSCRDRGGLYKKEKDDPTSENAPSSMLVTPLYTPLKNYVLNLPLLALPCRSDRRPAACGRTRVSSRAATRARNSTKNPTPLTMLSRVDHTGRKRCRTPTDTKPNIPLQTISGSKARSFCLFWTQSMMPHLRAPPFRPMVTMAPTLYRVHRRETPVR